MSLQTPIRLVGKVYKMYASRLGKLGITKLEDFLFHIPSRYEDYSLISKINQVQVGEIVTIQGNADKIKSQYISRFRTLQKTTISDNTGTIEVTWFNQPYLLNTIHEKDPISISGKVDYFNKKLIMQSPEYEILLSNPPVTIHTGRLVPVYPETKGISSKWLRRQVYKILQESKEELSEYLPYAIIENNKLMRYYDAIEQIHFPTTPNYSLRAKQRLAFDELLLTQIKALQKRKEWEKNFIANPFSVASFKKNIEEFWEKLPFKLTNAQNKAVQEIFSDLASNKPMNRLLEGDVGSGKTVVSAIAMYLAFLNGFQSVLMAPTEILANQHHQTISKLLSPFGINVGLVTGSKKEGIKNPFDLAQGEHESRIMDEEKKIHDSQFMIHDSTHGFDVLVGTHAVLSKKINFSNLGLVVIDEQQRFGVEQRALIKQKGKNPHLLTMTATPIPRTIALTLYGDLDLSILDEMPKGRRVIKTWFVPNQKREKAYEWIKSQLSTFKSQLFVICPFIEESETMQTIKAATKEYERLKNEVFRNLKLGLIHGKMKNKERDEVLNNFKEGKLDVLVATPIVEVGIDIPNATIILIEAAERFGLAQLHQLRGRVGRGDKQSYCLLFSESKNPQTIIRLKSMEKKNVGAELAELDLRLRGPGEIYGTMQHGRKFLKIASFSDFELIEQTKKEAENILPHLDKHPALLEKIKSKESKQIARD